MNQSSTPSQSVSSQPMPPAATQAATPLLSVQNLQVFYGSAPAVHNIHLQLAAGQIVTVIGPNGAGKSTLLNALMQALPVTGRVQGEIKFQQTDIRFWPIEQRVQAGLSLVPEKRELFGSMSVQDNLCLGAYVRKQARDRNYLDQLDEIYTLFPRLKERAKQQAGTLSGGERQMLALGRALMAKPKVLMLDEPSLGLAPLIVKDIFSIIDELRCRGVAILLVEQNARMALQTADYAYVLETGEIVLEGQAKDLVDNPQVIETYLGRSHT